MAQENQQKKHHHHREDLTGEHKLGDAGQLVLFILFLAAWIGDTLFFEYTTFLNRYTPLYARIPLGAILLVLAGYLAAKSHSIVFGEVRETPGIIRKGVYNHARHPMYLSEILLYTGLLIMSISLAAAVVWIAAIAFLHYISRHEEKLLIERFGDEYEQYMREVPMLLPRLRKNKK
jgi:protein-S-isoprenylcysteine O-methyltransferase Ste14